MAVKIIEMFIPKSNTFTRPGTTRKPRSITIHETDNTNVRANARAHALLQVNGNRRQASWHLQVDDEPEVYLSVPYNEVAWAAGDGNGPGNMYSIHIEMCVNQDGNYEKTVKNTTALVRYLLNKFPSITEIDVVQHHNWSGKNCPRNLRSGAKGINWNDFLKMVRNEQIEVEKPKSPPAYKTDNNKVSVNQKVTLSKNATHYATGERIPSKYKGKVYTIMQKGSNRVLLKELFSWVKISDLEGQASKSNAKPKPSKPSTSTNLKVGAKVTLSKNATKYATGETIPSRYKNKTYTIQQVRNDRVLLKELYSWVNIKDVGGKVSASKPKPKPKPKTLKVGQKVKIKSSAKKYSRVNVTIPSRVKGKSYTIQQVGKNDVLLKEIVSWVRKADVS